MAPIEKSVDQLSPWWRRAALLTMVVGFSVLILVAVLAYRDAPPIPARVLGPSGETLMTGEDILAGQEVFLKYGLMENGTIWGHGAYLGPDFSAAYLHTLGEDAAEALAQKSYGRSMSQLSGNEQGMVGEEVRLLLKQNRYNPGDQTLVFTGPEAVSYRKQIIKWTGYFTAPAGNGGLKPNYISDPGELRQLTSFFAWAAWASVARRPGRIQTYTNNFPYDPLVGNRPTGDAVLWSALSLVTLLVGTALVLLAFGKFDYLGWKGPSREPEPRMLPGGTGDSQKATIKFFLVVSLLFLAQVLVGGATAHFRADPGSFYGIDLFKVFPSNILRTWHLQLAIFWIATAYVAGGLLLSGALGQTEPKGQVAGINLLFWALVVVVLGSLSGELLGINQLFGKLWSWFGHQGWEYLDLGRAWQVMLAAGLVLWTILLFRAIAPALRDRNARRYRRFSCSPPWPFPFSICRRSFFSSTTNYTVVDNWRFWIIHLWVEGFFELFVTVMVAVISS